MYIYVIYITYRERQTGPVVPSTFNPLSLHPVHSITRVSSHSYLITGLVFQITLASTHSFSTTKYFLFRLVTKPGLMECSLTMIHPTVAKKTRQTMSGRTNTPHV